MMMSPLLPPALNFLSPNTKDRDDTHKSIGSRSRSTSAGSGSVSSPGGNSDRDDSKAPYMEPTLSEFMAMVNQEMAAGIDTPSAAYLAKLTALMEKNAYTMGWAHSSPKAEMPLCMPPTESMPSGLLPPGLEPPGLAPPMPASQKMAPPPGVWSIRPKFAPMGVMHSECVSQGSLLPAMSPPPFMQPQLAMAQPPSMQPHLAMQPLAMQPQLQQVMPQPPAMPPQLMMPPSPAMQSQLAMPPPPAPLTVQPELAVPPQWPMSPTLPMHSQMAMPPPPAPLTMQPELALPPQLPMSPTPSMHSQMAIPPPPAMEPQITMVSPPPGLEHLGPASPAALTKEFITQDSPKVSPADGVLEPALGSAELPSVGSAGHHCGTCMPCRFVHSNSCNNGINCSFCHLCPKGEKNRRKKAQKHQRKMEEKLKDTLKELLMEEDEEE